MQSEKGKVNDNNEAKLKDGAARKSSAHKCPHDLVISHPSPSEILLSDEEHESNETLPDLTMYQNIGECKKFLLDTEMPQADTLEAGACLDYDTQTRLEALLDAAGIRGVPTGDGKLLSDPDVLKRLTNSVSCALDEAAAALTRFRPSESDSNKSPTKSCDSEPRKPVPSLGLAIQQQESNPGPDQNHLPAADAGEAPAETSVPQLVEAVRMGDPQMLSILLQNQANPAAQTSSGVTALMEAASHGMLEMVNSLLYVKAPVNTQANNGNTALIEAATNGHIEVVDTLIKHHAKVNLKSSSGNTALMEAASGGHVGCVQILLKNKANVNAQSSCGSTALHYAAVGGHAEVVQLLLQYKANVEEHNENGHTPLMEAASAGHVRVAELLLKAGAGINTHSNEFKESALTLACYKGHLEMVKFLLTKGADHEHKTDEMHTALMEACMDGHAEVAAVLLDHGAQVNMPADSFESPLTLAACGGHVELASLLLQRGANLEEVNDEGYTPLMEAAREGHEEMVSLLLHHGADINSQTDETQETALTLACCGGFQEVADLLLKNAADIELGCSTPLMEAAQEGHLDLVKFLIKSLANIHAQTQTGDTALSYAAENGHTEVVKVLIKASADKEHKSEGGRTPLMKAARAGHLHTVQYLITIGADVNRTTSNNDHCVLSLACAGGHTAVVEALLKAGADPNHKLKDGSTMLIEASKGGHTTVVQMLLDWPNVITAELQADHQAHAALCHHPHHHNNHAPVDYHHHCQHSDDDEEDEEDEEEDASQYSHTVVSQNFKQSFINSVLAGSMTQPMVNLQDLDFSHPLENVSGLSPGSLELIQRNIQLSLGANPWVTSIRGGGGTEGLLSETLISEALEFSMRGALDPEQYLLTELDASTLDAVSEVELIDTDNMTDEEVVLTTSDRLQTFIAHMMAHNPEGEDREEQLKRKQQVLEELQKVGSLLLDSLPKRNSATQSTQQALQPQCSPEDFALLSEFVRQSIDHELQQTARQQFLLTSQVPLPQHTAQGRTVEQGLAESLFTVAPDPLPLHIALSTRNRGGWQPLHGAGGLDDVEGGGEAGFSAEEEGLNSGQRTPRLAEQESIESSMDGDLHHGSVYLTADEGSRLRQQLQDLQISDSSHSGENSPPAPPACSPSSSSTCPYASPVVESRASSEEVDISHVVPYNSYYVRRPYCRTAKLIQQEFELNSELQKRLLYAKCNNIFMSAPLMQSIGSGSPPKKKHIVPVSGPSMNHIDVKIPSLGSTTTYWDSFTTASTVKTSLDQLQQCLHQLKAQLSLQTQLQHEVTQQLRLQQEHEELKEQIKQHQQQIGKDNKIAKAFSNQLKTKVKPEVSKADLQRKLQQVQSHIKELAVLLHQAEHLLSMKTTIPPHDFVYKVSVLQSQLHQTQVQQFTLTAQQQQQDLFVPQVTQQPVLQGSCAHSVPPQEATSLATEALPVNQQMAHLLTQQDLMYKGAQLQQLLSLHRQNQMQTCSQPPPPPPTQPPAQGAQLPTLQGLPNAIICTGECHQHAHLLQQQQLASGKKQETRILTGQESCAEHTQPTASQQNNGPGPSQTTPPLYPTVPGVELDAQTESNHDTALTLACAGGHIDLVTVLIQRGANIEHRDKKGFTPLILAATAGHTEICTLLLENGAEMEAQSERTKDTALSLACSGGRFEVVQLLLNRGANKEHRNVSDYTPLSLAASGGYVHIIKLLLDCGAEINSRTGSKLGISPLMLAAMNGHVAAVKLLLDMGSDINAQIETNRNTALTLACFQGRHEVVGLLVDRKANIEHRAKTGLTPLMEAANGGYVEVGRVLLEKGADVNATPLTQTRESVLALACEKGHTKFVEMVLKWGAAVEARNKKGATSLWHACSGGHFEIVQMLLAHGADANTEDRFQCSALMAAFKKGHLKVVKLMVKHVTQFPSDNECIKFIQSLQDTVDKEMLRKTHSCMEVIITAKEKQLAEANKHATILLEEIESEKKEKEEKKEKAAKKREKRKQKKQKKQPLSKPGTEDKTEPDGEDRIDSEAEDEVDVPEEVKPPEKPSPVKEEPNCVIVQPTPPPAPSLATTKANSPPTDTHPTSEAVGHPGKRNRRNRRGQKAATEPAPEAPVEPPVPEPKPASRVPTPPKVETLPPTGAKASRQQPAVAASRDAATPRTSHGGSGQRLAPPAPALATPVPAVVTAPVTNVWNSKKRTANQASVNDLDEFPVNATAKNHAPRTQPQQQDRRASAKQKNAQHTEPSTAVRMSSFKGGSAVQPSPNKNKLGNKREDDWREVSGKQTASRKTHKMMIPSNAVSRVIGKAGCNINAVREASKSAIDLDKSKTAGDKMLTIKGSVEGIEIAVNLLNALISEPDKDIDSILERFKVSLTVTPRSTASAAVPQQVWHNSTHGGRASGTHKTQSAKPQATSRHMVNGPSHQVQPLMSAATITNGTGIWGNPDKTRTTVAPTQQERTQAAPKQQQLYTGTAYSAAAQAAPPTQHQPPQQQPSNINSIQSAVTTMESKTEDSVSRSTAQVYNQATGLSTFMASGSAGMDTGYSPFSNRFSNFRELMLNTEPSCDQTKPNFATVVAASSTSTANSSGGGLSPNAGSPLSFPPLPNNQQPPPMPTQQQMFTEPSRAPGYKVPYRKPAPENPTTANSILNIPPPSLPSQHLQSERPSMMSFDPNRNTLSRPPPTQPSITQILAAFNPTSLYSNWSTGGAVGSGRGASLEHPEDQFGGLSKPDSNLNPNAPDFQLSRGGSTFLGSRYQPGTYGAQQQGSAAPYNNPPPMAPPVNQSINSIPNPQPGFGAQGGYSHVYGHGGMTSSSPSLPPSLGSHSGMQPASMDRGFDCTQPLPASADESSRDGHYWFQSRQHFGVLRIGNQNQGPGIDELHSSSVLDYGGAGDPPLTSSLPMPIGNERLQARKSPTPTTTTSSSSHGITAGWPSAGSAANGFSSVPSHMRPYPVQEYGLTSQGGLPYGGTQAGAPSASSFSQYPMQTHPAQQLLRFDSGLIDGSLQNYGQQIPQQNTLFSQGYGGQNVGSLGLHAQQAPQDLWDPNNMTWH